MHWLQVTVAAMDLSVSGTVSLVLQEPAVYCEPAFTIRPASATEFTSALSATGCGERLGNPSLSDGRGDLLCLSRCFLVASSKEGQALAGCASARLGDGCAAVDVLTVVPRFRRQGLATALLAEVVSWAWVQAVPLLRFDSTSAAALARSADSGAVSALCERYGFVAGQSSGELFEMRRV